MGDSRNESFHESVAEGGCPRRPRGWEPRATSRPQEVDSTESHRDCKIQETEAGAGKGLEDLPIGPHLYFPIPFTDRESEKLRIRRVGEEPLKPRTSRNQELKTLESFFNGINGLELSLPFYSTGRRKMKEEETLVFPAHPEVKTLKNTPESRVL